MSQKVSITTWNALFFLSPQNSVILASSSWCPYWFHLFLFFSLKTDEPWHPTYFTCKYTGKKILEM